MSTFLRPIDHNDLTTGVSLSDEVYARIGAAIVDGSLAPGERLRDGDIAAQLGISRTATPARRARRSRRRGDAATAPRSALIPRRCESADAE
ncbi:GntR family transcriptional regulator [Microbacterium hominis]|uniref:GntR family transcriptional regulator n=1 Tax=Microbacterium hominis TaxID=162426 RepID=UPI003B005A93